MRKVLGIIFLSVLVSLVGFIAGCILDEKVIQIVATGETCSEEFEEDSQSEQFSTPSVVDYAKEIDRILADNDLTRDAILDAWLVGASYSVTDFSQTHDWMISGAITVERQDITAGPDTLVEYTQQSVAAALGETIPAVLNGNGVAIINQALQQYIAGTYNPVLVFTVENGTARSSPGNTPPSTSDPIVFKWIACVKIQVLIDEAYDVPDPF
ncbi:MAG: hypothetical protein GTO42_02170 [Candidatus Latescibacteria bacterium]|nr:hypothetical protein [Candidatus Latescibacterota bacterium]NIO00941.1 hypothetical protein [Candidatus Latescibacterota bacterium]NIO27340.1 hypothetical protein [Candidatus Latescibacterota bacterium]NIO54862.1 hypothetical protein [Candidatus Latescibacterota bacterium]NIT00951.1 hypothetical protein [Candidatus Latescibacterota bacterium]